MRTLTALLLALTLLPACKDSAPSSLGVGSPAPSITVEEWVKGDAVQGFDSGKVYVVEFWATWCGPCIQSIPHLTQMQKEHPEVTFMGIAASERAKKDGPDTRLSGLKTFVEKKGDAMGYRVAFDEDRSMGKSWMEAAGQRGIPCAFIVGKDGRIEWVGHPMEMDRPLAGVLANDWDRAKAREAAQADAAMETFLETELPKLVETAQRSGAWTPLVERMDAVAAKVTDPTQLRLLKFQVLAKGDQTAAACAAAKQLLDADLGASAFNSIAWTIATDLQGKDRDLTVALAAADKAVTLSKEAPEMLDTQARVHFEMGDTAKALEIERNAVASAEKAGTAGETMDELRQALKRYEAAANAGKG